MDMRPPSAYGRIRFLVREQGRKKLHENNQNGTVRASVVAATKSEKLLARPLHIVKLPTGLLSNS